MLRRLSAHVLLCAAALVSILPLAHAQTPTDLQAQIDDRNQKIAQIQAEIAQLQKELDTTGKQKQTLQSAVSSLDLSIKKVNASISLTQAQISRTDLEIQRLTGSISTTTQKIGSQKQSIAETMRLLNVEDGQSPAVSLLGGATLSSVFDVITTLGDLRDALDRRIFELSNLKADLENSKATAQGKRQELASYKSTLAGQQKALAGARSEKSTLLAQTKDQESNYQKLLAQKKAQEEQFERELRSFEAQLNLSVDPSSIPATGSGVLKWPVANPYITQYFGNTDFATKNAQVYGGKGHNAIDLRAPTGTTIRAALSGVVKGTGNTDLTCPNASYGKWVLIEHNNGLSTLYAHLSVVQVSTGQQVETLQTVGFSGSTGYATGPHLHFSVFATEGVQIRSFPSQGCKGRSYTMPVADIKAYLNPLSYL